MKTKIVIPAFFPIVSQFLCERTFQSSYELESQYSFVAVVYVQFVHLLAKHTDDRNKSIHSFIHFVT